MKLKICLLRHTVRYLALCAVALSLGLALPFGTMTSHAAAEPAGLQNVTLAISPEYDDPLQLKVPAVLVSMDGEIVGAIAPVTVRFLLPSNAALYSAGSGPRSQYIPPTPVPSRTASSVPGWDEISYTLKTQFFVVEYYEPISAAQPARSISYDFHPLYPVKNMTVTVQEPRRSNNFKVNPAGTPSTDAEGFSTHVYNFANLDPATTPPQVHFDISYTKSDNNPSLGSSASVGSGANTAAVVLIILGGIAVLVVAYILLKSRFSPSRAPVRTNIPRRGSTARLNKSPGKGSGTAKGGGRFCNQCGQSVEPGAQFCPYCGNKLRS